MRRQTSPSKARHKPRRDPGRRNAFTLVELLIVIAIIMTLMALIAPALQSVMTRVKEGQVRSEIVGLANACDSFNGTYGYYPPSYIRLSETGGNWTNESRILMRRIFGREFDFSKNRDINNNSTAGENHVLTGSECLVFFLGGVPTKDASGNFVLNGFSKSKADPFKLGGTNRIKFYTEWKLNRLKDSDNDGFPEYCDEFNEGNPSSPYLYASTTRTGKYEANPDISTGTTMTKVYLQSETSATVWTPWKDKAFQIISPGRDGLYGTGGLFTEDEGVGARFDEEDNLTNFSRTRLGR